jgi:hypothetical protein
MRTRFFIILVFILLSIASWHLLEGFVLRNYITLIPILFSIQILLNDFIETYLFMNLKTFWFKILIAPGTILHELSHALAARITGCRIIKMSLFRFDSEGNLGSVEYVQLGDKLSVLRNFIVGFAPFFGCGVVLLALLNLAQDYYPGEVLTADFVNVESVQSVLDSIALIMQRFYRQFLSIDVNFAIILILYLQTCVGLGAAPSSIDLKSTFSSAVKKPMGTVILLLTFASVFYLGENQITSRYVILSFRWIIFILLVSTSLLIASIPFIYLGTKFVELTTPKKFFTVVITAITYPATNDIFLTLLAFLMALFVLRYSWILLKEQ